MKLLFVHEFLGTLGGAENDILLAAQSLRRRGHAVGLLYQSATGRDEQAWRETFNPCAPVASPDLPPDRLVESVVRSWSPDLLYVQSISNLEILRALVSSGRPLVRRVHDHRMYCLRGYKYNYFTRAICTKPTGLRCIFPCLAFVGHRPGGRLPLRWASYSAKRQEIQLNRQFNAFVVYSGSQKQELVRNGFDPQRIHVQVPVQCRGSGPVSSFSERNLILFVGQVIRGKGVDVLLRSLAKLKTPFEAVILGDGNHRSHCERLSSRLGLARKVRFAGFVQRDQLRNYLLEATCLVVSSVWPEPFGLVGPEAMLHGLPVVAFDSGGIREWLADGESGFLVPWMDTDRLSARIEQLLLDKNLARRLGKRGMELVNQVYDADLQIDALEKILLNAGRIAPRARAPLRAELPMNPEPVTL